MTYVFLLSIHPDAPLGSVCIYVAKGRKQEVFARERGQPVPSSLPSSLSQYQPIEHVSWKLSRGSNCKSRWVGGHQQIFSWAPAWVGDPWTRMSASSMVRSPLFFSLIIFNFSWEIDTLLYCFREVGQSISITDIQILETHDTTTALGCQFF